MDGFLLQATLYLTAALAVVPVAVRLGLGSVLGYLLAGIFIGPVFGLVGAETTDLQHFAEFGVVMMLFLIGLELEPKALWDMRDRLIGLGGLQVGVTTLAIMGGRACIWPALANRAGCRADPCFVVHGDCFANAGRKRVDEQPRWTQRIFSSFDPRHRRHSNVGAFAIVGNCGCPWR